MFEHLLVVHRFNLGYCQSLIADIDDADFARQPIPGGNHPAWILGHLCLTADGGLRLLGQPMLAPESWRELFGRTTTPVPQRDIYPTKQALWQTLETLHERLAAAVRTVTPEQAAKPHSVPLELLRQRLPTVGDLLAHILSTHEAMHWGNSSSGAERWESRRYSEGQSGALV